MYGVKQRAKGIVFGLEHTWYYYLASGPLVFSVIKNDTTGIFLPKTPHLFSPTLACQLNNNIRREQMTTPMEQDDVLNRYATELTTWKQDPRWMNAAYEFYSIHSHFRKESAKLSSRLTFLSTEGNNALNMVKRGFEQLMSNIHFHHRIEEQYFFPGMKRKFKAQIDDKALSQMEQEHTEMLDMEKHIQKLFPKAKEDANLLQQLQQDIEKLLTLLLVHLAREELLLTPHLLTMDSIHSI